MNGQFGEMIFAVLAPVYFFIGLSLIITFALYLAVPNLSDVLKKHGLDLGLFDDESQNNPSGSLSHLPLVKGGIKKLPAVGEHRQAVGIYANGKFENPIKDYNTKEKELQEV